MVYCGTIENTKVRSLQWHWMNAGTCSHIKPWKYNKTQRTYVDGEQKTVFFISHGCRGGSGFLFDLLWSFRILSFKRDYTHEQQFLYEVIFPQITWPYNTCHTRVQECFICMFSGPSHYWSVVCFKFHDLFFSLFHGPSLMLRVIKCCKY